MSGFAVTVVDSGGLAVTAVESGAPLMTAVDAGGLPVTLVESGGMPFVVEGAATSTGTSPDRYSFAGTGLRAHQTTLTISSNNYRAWDHQIGFPDWDVDHFYLHFPVFSTTSGAAEAKTTSVVTVEGIALWIGATRVPCLIDDSTASIVVNPASRWGRWIKVTPTQPIAAGSLARIAYAQHLTNGTYPRSNRTTDSTLERGSASASSLLSTLSGGTAYNNSGSGLFPDAMICKGGDGRPAVYAYGDSIGIGSLSHINFLTARRDAGFISEALDDNVSSLRLPFINRSMPGWGIATAAVNSHSNPAAIVGTLEMLADALAINEGKPLADVILCQHGTNSSTGTAASLKDGLRAGYDIYKEALGAPNAHVAQVEMMPYPTSTDGFQTLGNQAPSTASQDYPTGTRWLVNEAIGGPDGLGDPTAELRADGSIDSSMAPWRVSGYDTGDNRDLLKVRPFKTTLAADWTTGLVLSCVAAPTVGMNLMVYDAVKGTEDLLVSAVTGAGPYSVTVISNSGGLPSGGYAAGTVVQDTWHGGGLHPGPWAHTEYANQVVIPWKIAQGWV